MMNQMRKMKRQNNIIINEDKSTENKKEENEIKDDPQSTKIYVNKIINEQNFLEGFWELNPITQKIKEKYEKEFEKLKSLKDKNINDTIAITILIVYFFNKEHAELLNELFLILEKEKIIFLKTLRIRMKILLKKFGYNFIRVN